MFTNRTTFDPITKIWSGQNRHLLYNFKISLGDVILYSLSREPTKITQISDNSGVRLTNADLSRRTVTIAKWLIEIGCRKNDVIGLVVRNSENVTPLALAGILCAAPINTLDTAFTRNEIVHMFSYTKPKFVFCDEDKYDVVKESLEKLELNSPIFTIRDGFDEVISIAKILRTRPVEAIESLSLPVIEDGSTHTAFITCSSGTTGLPKGVCLSHSALLQGSGTLNLLTNDTLLCFSSLYWYSGVLCLVSATVTGCTRIITDEAYSAEIMLRMTEQYKASVIFGPPSQIALSLQCPDIEERDLSSVRHYLCGGSEVSPILVSKMNAHLKNGFVKVGYGMTEIGGVCTLTDRNSKLGTVGQLFNNLKVKILDSEGNKLGVGERGEVVIKPIFEFLGYYGRPEETEKILDQEGWIHSGDIGYFDEDGDLILVDRIKDILKYKCYQYSPSEIENKVLEVPGVSQVSVCGIPDPIVTDLPAALVVRMTSSNVSENEIYDYVAVQLSEHKYLRGGIYFVDSLPMTSSGKIKRAKVKELAVKFYNQSQHYYKQ